MKQVFKRQTLTKKKCVNSILRFYELASIQEIQEGTKWYNEANEYCRKLAERFNLSLSQVVGIIASFSPQTDWTQNKRFTLSFLLNRQAIVKNLVQTTKAKKIILLNNELDIYHALSIKGKAFKTKAFFLNILNPDLLTTITCDRHCIAVCLQSTDDVYADNKNKDLTKVQYDFFKECYFEAAKELNILPQNLQAITWLVYRRLRELKEHVTEKQWQPFETAINF